MYELIAWPLEKLYQLVPNYAVAIALLTLVIMVLLMPLTLKGTRSMLAMQKLQPEMKKLQQKHRDDRQKLNEEMMKFYKENNINPMAGCLPLLLQMPVFFFLYRTLYQLINHRPYGEDMGAAVARARIGETYERYGYFRPKHLSSSSKLYQDLSSTREMRSFGLNLAESAQKALTHNGFTKALPFIILVLAVTATSYYQQRQITARTPQAQANPQQQMLMKIMPLFFMFISFTLPAFIVVYFFVSNMFRIGQQALITHTMYKDEHGNLIHHGAPIDTSSADAKPKGFFAALKEAGLPDPAGAKKAAAESSGKKAGTTKGSGAAKGAAKSGATKTATKTAAKPAPKAAAPAKATTPKGGTAAPSRTAPASANRSKNKKKRR